MRNKDFAVFILTHGRADRVVTYHTLNRLGYTGKLYLIIDNEDAMAQEYYDRYGDKVIMFDKLAIAQRIDEGDNGKDRRTITYARNASYDIARDLGITYFVQLDDDYVGFEYKIDGQFRYPSGHFVVRKGIDDIFDWMLDYYKSIQAVSIAMAQTGDFIGGRANRGMLYKGRRKCMNSFFCSTERPIPFVGRFNEDVNTYVWFQSIGNLFLTVPFVAVKQTKTQSSPGGITELYKSISAHVKPFFTVMYAPSCVKVGMMNTVHGRLHHKVSWKHAVPCIVPERYRKVSES